MDRAELPVMAKILKIEADAKNISNFTFDYPMKALPGQFFLLWIPGVDEKPFGVSHQENKTFSSMICKVGGFTEKLFALKTGDMVGIRGPYGTHFSLRGKSVALVAGGYGVAPLSFLADETVKTGIKVHFIYGAKTKDSLVLCRNHEKSCNVLYSTDDGSLGSKGFATDVLKDLLNRERIDMIYTVGPELMMKKVVEISDTYNIPCELSLERYMKCGIGICGQCCVDDLGIRMCKEGPVIDKSLAKKIREFGLYHRDAAGKKKVF